MIGLQKEKPLERYQPPVKHYQPQANLEIVTARLQANQQSGPTCGYHAAFNAKAIQDLFDARKPPINEKDIQKQAQKYFKHLGKHELETYEIVFLGDTIGLKNVYFLKYDRTTNSVQPAGTVLKVKEDLETFFKKAKTRERFLTQFICNTGGHWILISAIKEPGKALRLNYLDSANGSIKPGSIAHTCIGYIRKAITI